MKIEKLGAFLDWASFSMGAGSYILLTLGAAVVGGAAGAALRAGTLFITCNRCCNRSWSGLSFLLGSYAMGVGDTTNAQLKDQEIP